MSRSRARLAADWFAKLRQNAVTQEVEHTDVVAAEAAASAEAEAVAVAAAASMESAISQIGAAKTSADWNDNTVVGNVIGQMAWQNYGNNHTIFDASASTSPSGTAVNNANSTNAWSATYPTLMGWNGANTYGVRVDTARYADSANTANRAYPKRVGDVDLNFNWSGQSGQPPWLWGGSDGSNMYVYNPSNFSVNYANTAGSVSPPAAGSVGSYAILRSASTAQVNYIYEGSGYAGSGLVYSGIATSSGNNARSGTGGAPSGSWRAMGRIDAAFSGTNYRLTLFLRYA
jgi:hypothetical protein